MKAQSPISISVAPLNRLTDRHYYDLDNTLVVMQRLLDADAVDGFEFQHLAEWDARCPPRAEPERESAWEISQHYSIDDIANTLNTHHIPILSVHANRDVGCYLCSNEPMDVAYGKQLVQESLQLTQKTGAKICVFHLWDTWKEYFDPNVLREALDEATAKYPDIKATVENVPTHLKGHTPFNLVQPYPWITLDLRWAALYEELDKFTQLKGRLANVHLSGQLNHNNWGVAARWFPARSTAFTFDEALNKIRTQWNYTGPLTIEIYGQPSDTWDHLVAAMKTLKEKTQ